MSDLSATGFVFRVFILGAVVGMLLAAILTAIGLWP